MCCVCIGVCVLCVLTGDGECVGGDDSEDLHASSPLRVIRPTQAGNVGYAALMDVHQAVWTYTHTHTYHNTHHTHTHTIHTNTHTPYSSVKWTESHTHISIPIMLLSTQASMQYLP